MGPHISLGAGELKALSVGDATIRIVRQSGTEPQGCLGPTPGAIEVAAVPTQNSLVQVKSAASCLGTAHGNLEDANPKHASRAMAPEGMVWGRLFVA